MIENYEKVLAVTLTFEGGYSNNKSDPGGATMKGVTQRVYNGFRQLRHLPNRNVKNIEPDELLAIYRGQYWNKVRGDELPDGVDLAVFDAAVHSGPNRSVRWLQAALGVKVDGILGEATVAACKDYPDHDALVQDVVSRRLAFCEALKTWKVFGNGWKARMAGVLRTSQAWATGSVGPTLVYVDGAHVKAEDHNLDRPSPTLASAADAQIAGGSVTTVLASATQQIEALKDMNPVFMKIFVGLTVAGVVVTAMGAALRWYNSRKAARAEAIESCDLAGDLSELDSVILPAAPPVPDPAPPVAPIDIPPLVPAA